MDEAEYEEGEYIITQGEEGDKFYLLVEGGAVARIRLPAGEKEVKWYKKGGYFGELALMRDEPRAASSVATTRSKCAFLQKQRFQDLMQLHKRLRERLEAVLVNYSSVKPQKAFEDLLASVPLLSPRRKPACPLGMLAVVVPLLWLPVLPACVASKLRSFLVKTLLCVCGPWRNSLTMLIKRSSQNLIS